MVFVVSPLLEPFFNIFLILQNSTNELKKEGRPMGLDKDVRGLNFIEKLQLVSEKGKLDFWEIRKFPPNLTKDEFLKVLTRIRIIKKFKWSQRKSEQGPYGLSGEDNWFKFECEVRFIGTDCIQTKKYFVKGYFFEKFKLIGVTIQSFRRI